MERIIRLYERVYGTAPVKVERLVAAGSSRDYWRCYKCDGSSVVATHGQDVKENHAFIEWSNLFVRHNLHVPEIIAVSDDGLDYLQTDVGDCSLYSLLEKYGVEADEVWTLLEQCMKELPHFHLSIQNDDFNWQICYPREAMDKQALMWDFNYFKYCFLKPAGIEPDDELLEKDFQNLANDVLSDCGPLGVMLRDYQSRNVMIHSQYPYVIDFQGARRGPVLYDVASFLWQARIGLNSKQRIRLSEIYKAEFERLTSVELGDFARWLSMLAFVRVLQVLGAYGFRGLVQHKSTFVTSIPRAVAELGVLLNQINLSSIPYFSKLLEHIVNDSRWQLPPSFKGLTVSVWSFSYKKGVPVDFSGNGGGYVFDCRAVHNPGRYAKYVPLTGLDAEVKDFFDEKGDIYPFLKSCAELVDASIARYISRGFSSLQICFGCTGGRHRSVFSAEWMARHINEKFPEVRVLVGHREQGILPHVIK